MAPEDQSEEPIRVTDRRRFTETGDARSESSESSPESADVATAVPAPEAPPEAAPATAEAPSAPAPTEAADAEGPESDGNEGEGLRAMGVEELGIQAVFFAFWQSAMMALGAQDPAGRSAPVSLEDARQSIGLLQVLHQKTSGNLSSEEEQTLVRLLHEAQMAYIQVAGPPPAGENP
jgi:hypothetical protein